MGKVTMSLSKVGRLLVTITLSAASAAVMSEASEFFIDDFNAEAMRDYCKTALKCEDIPNSCKTQDRMDASTCNGYIIGSRVGYYLGLSAPDSGGKLEFCIPEEASIRQLIEVFLKYIRDHPDKLHISAARQVYDSWAIAFPCAQ